MFVQNTNILPYEPLRAVAVAPVGATTKDKHDAAIQKLEKARQGEEKARVAHEKNQKQKK